MDSAAQRRPGAIRYGKKTSKVLGYNFYHATPASATIPTATSQYPISPSSPGTRDAIQELGRPSPSPSRQRSSVMRPAHVTAHSPASGSTSPVKRSQHDEVALAAFDIGLSDLDHSDSDRPTKKRKISKLQPKNKDRKDIGQNAPKSDPDELQKEPGTEIPVVVTKRAIKKKGQEAEKSMEARESGYVETTTRTTTQKLRRTLHKNSQTHGGKDGGETQTESGTDVTGPVAARVASARLRAPKSTTMKTKVVTNAIPMNTSSRESTEDVALIQHRERPKTKVVSAVATGTQLRGQAAPRKKVRTKKPAFDELRPPFEFKATKQTIAPAEKVVQQIMNDLGEDMEILKTPKARLRQSADSDSSVGSPSQLGLRDLHLASKHSTPSRRLSLSPASSGTPSPQQRGRARQIDMLDVPEPSHNQPTSRSASRGGQAASMSRRMRIDEAHPSAAPQLTRTNSSQDKQTFGKARYTYGSNRSHLAEMVDDLDVMSNSSSQQASQRLVSQLASQPSQSQLDNELDLNDSSSDDTGFGGKLLSIHQLRQVGANNRFERDLELLLEDIEPTSAAASSTVRLLSLMKMFKRMAKEASFESYVIDHALDRLVAWSRLMTDRCSRLIMDMMFWRFVHARAMTPRLLLTMVPAVTASAGHVNNLNTLAFLVKNPKEQVPKTIHKDIQLFEDTVIKGRMLPAYEGDRIVPAAISIAALNDSLRKLVETSASNVTMGKTAYEGVVTIMKGASQITADNKLNNPFITKLTLSLLQLFTGPMGSDLSLEPQSYTELGNDLASIVDHSIDTEHQLVSSVLHFAISLCNDRPGVCTYIGNSRLPASLVRIVDARFIRLVQAADDSQNIDTTMLDSIILSLACLLNMTEFDNAVRKTFAEADHGFSTHLAALVRMYAAAHPILEHAKTIEQSQVMVAFGYLSLLICNLCLDDDVWQEVVSSLETTSIADIKVSAKTLLIHLRTLEVLQDQGMTDASMISEAGASDGFTQRFEEIISAVKDT